MSPSPPCLHFSPVQYFLPCALHLQLSSLSSTITESQKADAEPPRRKEHKLAASSVNRDIYLFVGSFPGFVSVNTASRSYRREFFKGHILTTSKSVFPNFLFYEKDFVLIFFNLDLLRWTKHWCTHRNEEKQTRRSGVKVDLQNSTKNNKEELRLKWGRWRELT